MTTLDPKELSRAIAEQIFGDHVLPTNWENDIRIENILALFTQPQLQLLSELKDGLPKKWEYISTEAEWQSGVVAGRNEVLEQITAQIDNLMKGSQ